MNLRLSTFASALAFVAATAATPAFAQNVKLATSMGDITIALDKAKAPKTVENFLSYVKAGHYDGTVFHRVIADFMIQGGGMDAEMKEKPTKPPIALESGNGLSNVRGSIAMARTQDPNSATSQFFINVVDNPRLDKAQARDGNGYTVFGKVVAGMDVVDKIRAVEIGPKSPHEHVPVKPVLVKKATEVAASAAPKPASGAKPGSSTTTPSSTTKP